MTTEGLLCSAPAPNHLHHCTRERGHHGPHIATVGPYWTGLPVLAEWGSTVLRGGQPGGGKETAQRLAAIRAELARHDEANAAGAGKVDCAYFRVVVGKGGPQPVVAVDDLRWLLSILEEQTRA